ncbi:MAG TPA: metallophosphoesterase [Dissulfurispiraceae bacterium]
MSLFFVVFFSLYSGMHFYAFLRARAAYAFGAAVAAPLSLFMLLMIFAPFLIRMSEKHGFEWIARLMSYVGYTWMGVLFLFCSASIVVDAYRVLVHVSGFLAQRNLASAMPSARSAFLLPLIVSAAIAMYGYFEAKHIRTERVELRTPKIPAGVGRLTIVQISDVHVGLIVREDRLGRIVEKVKEAKPDILVSTGDLVDGQINGLEGMARLLSGIDAKYGKFAVLGNHEYYAGINQAMRFTRNAGFTILRDTSATGIINIAGVDDPAGGDLGVSERELLAGLPRDKFTLFLKHRPLVKSDSLGLYDLQLSGHAHDGQIFPFTLIVKQLYPTAAGWLDLPKNSHLYVSRGSGTWGPPIRFLAPPEVTVIELVSAPDRESR